MRGFLTLPMTLLFAPLAAVLFVEPAVAGELPLAFIKQHCFECHCDSIAEGGFRADRLTQELADSANHKAWSRVLARVQSGRCRRSRVRNDLRKRTSSRHSRR